MAETRITEKEAKLIIEVLNEGMPDEQKKRDKLAKLSIRLEDFNKYMRG